MFDWSNKLTFSVSFVNFQELAWNIEILISFEAIWYMYFFVKLVLKFMDYHIYNFFVSPGFKVVTGFRLTLSSLAKVMNLSSWDYAKQQ